MANDAMQQNRIRDIAAKRHLRINTRRTLKKPDDDPDRRGARYAMYRGVVGWLWANPLGAEQRVPLQALQALSVRSLPWPCLAAATVTVRTITDRQQAPRPVAASTVRVITDRRPQHCATQSWQRLRSAPLSRGSA